MKNFSKRTLFLIGVLLKLFLLALFTSQPVIDWYAPFLNDSVSSFSFNPWKSWVDNQNSSLAFPYGYAMWITFLPFTLVGFILNISSSFTYSLTLFFIDILLFQILLKLFTNKTKEVIYFYWLSPIVILCTYIFGLNDIVPIFYLLLSLFFLKELKFLLSGLFLIIAISAKISVLISLPVFLIYFLHNPKIKNYFPIFFKGLVFGFTVFILPFLFSAEGLSMIISNPEVQKLYTFSFNYNNEYSIYFVHLFYLIMLYNAWRVKRLNYDLFYAILGIIFFIVILFVPSSPGWFVWIVPFLLIQFNSNKKNTYLLTSVFHLLFIINNCLDIPFPLFFKPNSSFITDSIFMNENFNSILYTLMIGLGIILSFRMWREAVTKNDYFKLSQKPFGIGIAGDSGSGKDTLAELLIGLFGSHSVSHLSGDSYHLWDRKKPMWNVMTHLNPMANDIDRFSKDIIKLSGGSDIKIRDYNHSSGKMSKEKKLKSKDFIIASGLHALYLPIIRECYNLKIYLDMDEELRQFFKIKRDSSKRGHSEVDIKKSIESRKIDFERYIKNQADFSDIIFSLKPDCQIGKDYNESVESFQLEVIIKNGLYDNDLIRSLISICKLDVDIEAIKEGKNQEIKITINGHADKEDIIIASYKTCPEVIDFLDSKPNYENGMKGVMQLITLNYINQDLKRIFT
tara:strand:+ start:179 stop:2221 length:2043 start_codon:yes stop_codon:yes gene_type:complete